MKGKALRKPFFSALTVMGILIVGTILAFSTFAPQSASAASLVARDTFTRANQQFWGRASDGQKWGADANIAQAFSIKDNKGIITGGSGVTFNAVLGGTFKNGHVFLTGNINSFKNANFGGLLRWNGGQTWYKAFINGSELVIEKRVNGTFSRLASRPFAAQAGQDYVIHFNANGTFLAASVWKMGFAEPLKWMLTTNDSSISAGQTGLRVDIPGATKVTLRGFTAEVW